MSIKYPKGETVWVSYYDREGAMRFFTTSKPLRDWYFLYEVKEDLTYVKLGKARSPTELEEKFKVNEKIRI